MKTAHVCMSFHAFITFLLPWTRSKYVVTQWNSVSGGSIGHNGSILSYPKLQTWKTRPIKTPHSKAMTKAVPHQSFLTPNIYF